jgi:hypothetical protein
MITVNLFWPPAGDGPDLYYTDYSEYRVWDNLFETAVHIEFYGLLGIDSASVTIDGDEYIYPTNLSLNDVGGGYWELNFRYNENPGWGGWEAGEHTVSYEITDPHGSVSDSHTFTLDELWSGGEPPPDVPEKAINPTPEDSANPGVDFSDFTLSWENGGGAETYNIVAVDWNGAAATMVSGLEEPTYTFSESNIYREMLTGLTSALQWRVDSVNEEGTTTGDTWTFDPRPAKVTTPSPEDDDTEIHKNVTLSWDASTVADSYNVYLDTGSLVDLVSAGQEGTSYTPSPLRNHTEYLWRVDAINEFGITTGNEWSFTTIRTVPPSPTFYYNGDYYRLLVQSDGTWGTPPPDGVENTDYTILSGYLPNFMNVNQRLILFARCGLYYED